MQQGLAAAELQDVERSPGRDEGFQVGREFLEGAVPGPGARGKADRAAEVALFGQLQQRDARAVAGRRATAFLSRRRRMGSLVAEVVLPAVRAEQRHDRAVLRTRAAQVDLAGLLEDRPRHRGQARRAERLGLGQGERSPVAGGCRAPVAARLGQIQPAPQLHQPERGLPRQNDRLRAAAPQGEHRGQEQRRPLVAGQSEPERRLRPDELGQETIGEVGDEVHPDQPPAQKPAALEAVQDHGGGEVEGRFVELGGVAELAVAEVDSPGERGDGAKAAAGAEAGQAAHGHGPGQRHGEAVAHPGPDAQGPFGQLHSEVAADQPGHDGLAVVEPGSAAEKTLPVGQDKGELGADHAAAERAQPEAELLPGAQPERLLGAAEQRDARRHGRRHDCHVGPVHAGSLGWALARGRKRRIRRTAR